MEQQLRSPSGLVKCRNYGGGGGVKYMTNSMRSAVAAAAAAGAEEVFWSPFSDDER